MSEIYQLPINGNTTYWDDYQRPRFKELSRIADYILSERDCRKVQFISNWEADIFERNKSAICTYANARLVNYLRMHNNGTVLAQLDLEAVQPISLRIPSLEEWPDFFLYYPHPYAYGSLPYTLVEIKKSALYTWGGKFLGFRVDGVGGVLVAYQKQDIRDGNMSRLEGIYLLDADQRTILSWKHFSDLVGMIYEEASPNGYPLGEAVDPHEPIRKGELIWEAAAMYEVIRNRARYVYRTLWVIASELGQFNGWKKHQEKKAAGNPDTFYEYNTDVKTRCVINGILSAYWDNSDRYAQGAYFWDGWDIRTNSHGRFWGIRYTSDAHRIYGGGDTFFIPFDDFERRNFVPVYQGGRIIGYQNGNDKTLRIVKSIHSADGNETTYYFTHKLDTTCARGGTVFSKLCPIYKEIAGSHEFL